MAMDTREKDTKEKSFEHSFTIAGASIPVKANGSEVVLSPEIQTSSYLHHTQRACQEVLMEMALGGSAMIQDGKIRVNIPNHTWTEDEVKRMESHFQPLETHPDRPHRGKDDRGKDDRGKANVSDAPEDAHKIVGSGTQPKPPASETRTDAKR